MSYKVPGLSSIILLFAALAIADYQLFHFSLFLGLFYIVLTPVVFLNVMVFYCRKCPHVRDRSCRHVIFGWIVERLFKPVEPSKYTLKEIVIALLPLAAYMIFPQYWLFKNTGLAVAFWILALVAVIIVRTGVCTGCMNLNCSMCPNAKKSQW